ncbi:MULTISPECIES: hypothetical protein [unclassified Kaistella]|uniref:hypothetical protein n=1 Tax=unclassified Kaistella TaxID=2762626 RepID=UPI002734759B|nr:MULTISPECIES: hypothetical protein [unclassified Kaistella]MDP2454125.1 hypothetical protein [Kaistella sp. SH11-4b]MDP2457182.1 hypothetical protein [Kaistella sp. SH40-3]MDP2459940.1 hypothetical protein [Kaistella sp. SH19-2b]
MEYTVVENQFLDVLIKEVNTKIKEGWIPQGGISFKTDNIFYRRLYAQTLIKNK